MKYIDAEKLIAEIERRLKRYDPDYTNAGSELKELISFITSLQQERPSLPSNLDEAAENCTYCEHAYARESFKEGAEWAARQGETVEGYIAGINEVAAILAIPRKEHNKGDKVVVQIRKKQ